MKSSSSTSQAPYRPKLTIDTSLKMDENPLFEEMAKYSITPTTLKEKNFESSSSVFTENYQYAQQQVTRFGINAAEIDPAKDKELHVVLPVLDVTGKKQSTTRSNAYVPNDAKKVMHHSLEKLVMKQAVDHLFTTKVNTVIIDILDHHNGEIKINNDKLEVHSVVLYKNPVDM